MVEPVRKADAARILADAVRELLDDISPPGIPQRGSKEVRKHIEDKLRTALKAFDKENPTADR